MPISVDTLLFISAVGLLQAFFLSALIYFHPKSDHSVSKFLALYIFFLCLPMLVAIIQHFFPWQYMLSMDPIPLLHGPLLYLYVRSHKETITFGKAWPHFILFIIYVIVDTLFFIRFMEIFPQGKQVPPEIVHYPVSMVRVGIRIAQMIFYFFLAGHALNIYQRSINQLFSETSKISLAWVRWLLNGFLVLVLIMLGLYFVLLQYPEQFQLIMAINTAIVTPYIYIVTFKGVTQPTLWQLQGSNREKIEQEMHQAEEIDDHSNREEQKTSKTAMSSDKADDIASRAIALMEDEKLYLQTELTLQDLADKLGIPSYQVSQAINEGMKKTFYDLVNGYRVEEAKRLLLDPKTRNNKILAVGFDSGFNSKTTFNTVFKKFTGLTPTDFKEQELVH